MTADIVLARLPQQAVLDVCLKKLDWNSLNRHFGDTNAASDWERAWQELKKVNPPDHASGVNPGDQRALYYFVRWLKPASILEIGTHIGSSTLALALAATRNIDDGHQGKIVTVDIRDVNDQSSRPWKVFGSDGAPLEKLKCINLAEIVDFVVGDSLDVLQRIERKFDLIFLDGSHQAPVVYQEIPLALRCMSGEGCILLHDYFPDGKPLWPNRQPVRGPWKAIRRLKSEGANFEITPLGELPWRTKLGTNISSLAILDGKRI